MDVQSLLTEIYGWDQLKRLQKYLSNKKDRVKSIFGPWTCYGCLVYNLEVQNRAYYTPQLYKTVHKTPLGSLLGGFAYVAT